MTGATSCGWQLPRTRPLNGSPARWLRPVAGSRLHDTLSVIEIAFTAKYSSGVSARWASEIDRCRRGHRGKMDTRNVSSARSEGNALTMSWCLGNDTVTCCCRTMKYYNETRTHLSLNKDAPISRGVEAVGRILCLPILGGLHHHYSRI